MYSTLTKEEMMEWRRSTEKITLEEFASRLGKSVEGKKNTNDLHDLLLKKGEEPETIIESLPEKIEKTAKIENINKISEPVKKAEIETKAEVKEVKINEQRQEQIPDIEVKITFQKKLNKREELVFNYFCQNRKQKVMVKDIAKMLGLPNDYVYKYIKNLRAKLSNTSLLENADQGGYILNI